MACPYTLMVVDRGVAHQLPLYAKGRFRPLCARFRLGRFRELYLHLTPRAAHIMMYWFTEYIYASFEMGQ